jgi:hypothetical protein
LLRFLSNLITLQEKRAFHGENVVFFAFFVGSMRLLLEVFLVGYDGTPTMRYELLYVSWYFMCFFVFGLPVRVLAPPPWERRINVMLVGLFLGFVPPIIDVSISGWGEAVIGHRGFAYAYVQDFPEGWPLLMIDRERRMPPGEGIVLWLAVAFTGVYLGLRTKSMWRTLAGVAMAYAACVFVGAIMPTLAAALRKSRFPDEGFGWMLIYAQLAVASVFYLFFYRFSLALHVAARFVHALPLIGVSMVGYAWVKPLDARALVAVVLVAVSGVMTIVQNDHWDDLEERPDAPERVRRHDVVIVQFLWALLVAALLASDSVLAVILLVYGVASYLYNAPLYRGKRYFPANLKLEGLWGGAAFLIGVFAAALPGLIEAAVHRSFASRITTDMSMMPFSWGHGAAVAVAAFLAFGGWSVLATLKDEKDVATDERLGSQTVFTLLVRRGIVEAKVRRVVRALSFVFLSIAGWAPFVLGRVPWPYALVLTGLAGLVAVLRLREKGTEFRVMLVLISAHLVILAAGLSRAHV